MVEKKAMFNTAADVRHYCEENGIKMIDFKMMDLIGRWRHLSFPVARFTDDTLKYGIGFDGSNYGFAPVEKSDMVFIPDLSNASVDPFTEIPTLSMIGDVLVIGEEDNTPFDQYPRNVAKAAEQYMKDQGIADEMRIGPEFEFNIFDSVSYDTRPGCISMQLDAHQAEWHSRYPGNGYQTQHKGGYHIALPHDITYTLRSEISLMLEERGVNVKYHHHEVAGPGQVEIELEFGHMSEMADATMLVKYIVKNQAVAHGKTATFMPKPIFDEAGNGMHVHMHLFKNGRPLFYDKQGYAGLSETALYFIGGILEHAWSLCAFTNPSTNSFKRLVPGYEAPVTIGYATANRSAVIRIPAYAKDPMHKRFELRCIDATCNPYYAYSAILMAGLDGIEKKIDPSKRGWGPFDFNLYNLSPEEKAKIKGLPTSLDQALTALEEDHDYLLKGGVFSERLINIWVSKKREEEFYIRSYPHPAEFKFYYDL